MSAKHVKAKYMLDTNICIYIQREKPIQVLKKFELLQRGEAVISVVTWGELCYGACKSEFSKQTLILLEEFAIIIPVQPMHPNVGIEYGKIRADLSRQGNIIGSNDLWIAAHAKASDLILVSNNIKEFKRVDGLMLENWV